MKRFLFLMLWLLTLCLALVMSACEDPPDTSSNDNTTFPDSHTECYNDDGDHICDYCGNTMSECEDKTSDHRCDICDKAISECDYNNANGVCTVCGRKTSDDLEFAEVTGGYKVSGFKGSGDITALVIPATYNGKAVVEIGDVAFSALSELVTLSIPDSIKTVGYLAFDNCKKLNFTTLDNIKYLGNEQNPYVIAVGSTSPSQSELKIHKDCKAVYPKGFYDCTPTVVIMPAIYDFSSFLTNEAKANIEEITITAGEALNASFSLKGNKALTCVTLAASIKQINGFGAFTDCDNLSKVNYLGTLEGWLNIEFDGYFSNPLANGADLYIQNVILKEVVIPSTITQMNDFAFYACTSVEKMTIGDSVTKIGEAAFASCISLTEIIISNSVIESSRTTNPFSNCPLEKAAVPLFLIENLHICKSTIKEVVITNGAVLQESAFANYGKLEKVTLSSSIERIEKDAFRNCPLLQFNEKGGVNYLGNENTDYFVAMGLKDLSVVDVVLDEGCRFVYDNAFDSMDNIRSVTLSVATKRIGQYAFLNCVNLESVKIPQGVTFIGDSAFGGCTNLENVYIESLEAWCAIDLDYDGNGAPFISSDDSIETKLFLYDTLITELTIPERVEVIGKRAFYNIKSLTSVNLPSSIKSIERLGFAHCENITKIVFNGTEAEWNVITKGNLWDLNIKEYDLECA